MPLLAAYLDEHAQIAEWVRAHPEHCEHLATMYRKTLIHDEGRIFFIGNGGSAADAQHIAAEFVNGMTRKSSCHWPVLALTTDTSVITSIANDVAFDRVFAKQLASHRINSRDLVVMHSISGLSDNLHTAEVYCRNRATNTYWLTGPSSRRPGSWHIEIPTADGQVAQNAMMAIQHGALVRFEELLSED